MEKKVINWFAGDRLQTHTSHSRFIGQYRGRLFFLIRDGIELVFNPYEVACMIYCGEWKQVKHIK